MIVVSDDDSTADQGMISDFNKMSSGYMYGLADAYMISNNDAGLETLAVVCSDRLKPQTVQSRKVLTHPNRRQAPQIGTRTDPDLLHAKLSGKQAIAKNAERQSNNSRTSCIDAVFVNKSPEPLQDTPSRQESDNFLDLRLHFSKYRRQICRSTAVSTPVYRSSAIVIS